MNSSSREANEIERFVCDEADIAAINQARRKSKLRLPLNSVNDRNRDEEKRDRFAWGATPTKAAEQRVIAFLCERTAAPSKP